jgi:hypothetical protein
VPPGAGRIVAAEWDFEGDGTFPVKAALPRRAGATVTIRARHSFTRPGTYFPALRVVSQRQGDATTPFARIQNLGRVRVMVE